MSESAQTLLNFDRPVKHGSQLKDITGRRFGRLIAIEFCGIRLFGLQKKSVWKFRCDCGKVVDLCTSNVKCGYTKSCGCFRVEVATKKAEIHGHSRVKNRSKTYGIWCSMRNRCFDQNVKSFPRYGGRGITVCERWLKFENFLADMGEKPDRKTLERKDNSKGYEPGNCKWATRIEQANNCRTNRRVKFHGLNLTMAQWGRKTGIMSATIISRLNKGWSVERALTERP